jgi:hypothetical protein
LSWSGGGVHLNWGGDINHIRKRLEEAGLWVEWNGRDGTRPVCS